MIGYSNKNRLQIIHKWLWTQRDSMATRKLANYFVGQVIQRGISRPDTVKVRTKKMVLDKYLTKYFNKNRDIWAVENKLKVNQGDIVLIKELPIKHSPRISYEIDSMVFKLGETIDPVTGRRCKGKQFADEEALKKMQQYFTEDSDRVL